MEGLTPAPELSAPRTGCSDGKGASLLARQLAEASPLPTALLPKIIWDHSMRYSAVRAPSAHGCQAELHPTFKPHGNLPIRQRFSTPSHKQWIWQFPNSICPYLLISIHVPSQQVPFASPSLGLYLHSQWTKDSANNKSLCQWNLCFTEFYLDYFLEAFKIFFFSLIWTLFFLKEH